MNTSRRTTARNRTFLRGGHVCPLILLCMMAPTPFAQAQPDPTQEGAQATFVDEAGRAYLSGPADRDGDAAQVDGPARTQADGAPALSPPWWPASTNYIVEFVNQPSQKIAPSVLRQRTAQDHAQFKRDLASIARAAGSKALSPGPRAVRREFYELYNGVAVALSSAEVEAVAALPYVARVHPDLPVEAHLPDSVPWIGADRVWNELGATGQGITVGIIDTGIDYTHPDLGGGFGSGYKVVGGYDFVNDDADPADDHGHGTHVAGIVAADGSVVGVAPDARLMAFKVLDGFGQGQTSDIVAGLERAFDPDQNPATPDAVDVVNLSLGGAGTPDDPMSQALDMAVARGIVCVVSSGNKGYYGSVSSPGCARLALTVGASDFTDTIAAFSSRGPAPGTGYVKPDVCAPGVDILSLGRGNTHVYNSGTSMAAPHVAGAAALLLQRHPDRTPAQVKASLTSTAVDLGFDVMTQGAGRIDAYAATRNTLLIEPGVVNLGEADQSLATWTTGQTLTVTNRGTDAVACSLTVDTSALPAGVTAAVIPAVTVPAGGSESVAFELTVDNGLVPNLHELPYSYEGWIVLQEGTNTLRVPFAFTKEQPDTMEPNNSANDATPIAIDERRSVVGRLGRTKIDPTQPGASDPDEDWYTFTGEAGKDLFVYVDAQRIGSTLQARLELCDANRQPVAPTTLVEGDPRIVFFRIPSTATYYIRVASADSSIGHYRLFAHYLSSAVRYTWTADYPVGGNAVSGVAFSDGGDYLYTGQYYSYLQLFETDGDGDPLYSLEAASKEYDVFSASEDGSVFIGCDAIAFGGDGYLEIYHTPSATPVARIPYPPETIKSAAVSPDGSRILLVTSSGLEVRDGSGNVIKTVPQTISPYAYLSAITQVARDGSFMVRRDGEDYIVYDVAHEREVFRTMSHGMHVSEDMRKICWILGDDVTYLTWDGEQYLQTWTTRSLAGDRHAPYYDSDMSDDGSVIAIGYRHAIGSWEDAGESYYVLDGATGRVIGYDRTPKDRAITLQSWPYAVEVSGDGRFAAFITTGGDRRAAELVLFNRDCPTPVFRLATPGSGYSIDLKGNRLALGIVGRHINIGVHPDDLSGALYVVDLSSLAASVPPRVEFIQAVPGNLAPGESVAITCRAEDSDGVASLVAQIEAPDENSAGEVVLLDDGAHGDGAAGDGLWGGTWTTGPLPADYRVDVVATDTAGTLATYDNGASFSTRAAPWVHVTGSAIYGKPNVNPGELQYFSLSFANDGGAPAAGVQARVFCNDRYLTRRSHMTVDLGDMAAGASVTTNQLAFSLSVSELAPSGHVITVGVTTTDRLGHAWTEHVELPAVLDQNGPVLSSFRVRDRYVAPGSLAWATVQATDRTAVDTVQCEVTSTTGAFYGTISLFDDGAHEDGAAQDGVYGGAWKTYSTPGDYLLNFVARDTLGNQTRRTAVTGFSTVAFAPASKILLVNASAGTDQQHAQSYKDTLAALGQDCDYWMWLVRGNVPDSVLSQYRNGIVIFAVAHNQPSALLEQIDPAQRQAIANYLEGGGRLLMSGTYNGTRLGNTPLFRDYLHATHVQDQIQLPGLTGVAGDPIGDGLSLSLDSPWSLNEVDVSPPAYPILTYDPASGTGDVLSSGTAAFRVESSYRAVFYAFRLWSITNANDRKTLLGRTLDWLGGHGVPQRFEWDTVASPQTRTRRFAVRIRVVDYFGDVVTGFAGTANLTASNGSAPATVIPAATGAFVNGVWTGTVAVAEAGNAVRLRADDGEGHHGVSNDFVTADFSDSDQDGLPDDWEFEHFEYLKQDAGDDGDADGVSNWEEWQNGTDPSPGILWVDFAYSGTETGAITQPFSTVAHAIALAQPHDFIRIRGSSSIVSNREVLRITKPLRIEAVDGTVHVGRE